MINISGKTNLSKKHTFLVAGFNFLALFWLLSAFFPQVGISINAIAYVVYKAYQRPVTFN